MADAEVEKMWVKEAEARWAAFERGKIEAVPYESVLDKYRDKRDEDRFSGGSDRA